MQRHAAGDPVQRLVPGIEVDHVRLQFPINRSSFWQEQAGIQLT
jgi:hypothetical protein